MKVTWLHLTDLHRGMAPQRGLWANVEEQFFADLTKLHERHGTIDLILFTGDFVEKGSKAEYEKLNVTLSRLRDHLAKLGSNPSLLGVPGNHDLVRPKSAKAEVQVLADWESKPEVQAEFWHNTKSSYRKLINKAFANYTTWLETNPFKKLSTRPGLLPGDFAVVFEKQNITIGIVGLNSTFLQLTSGNFEGRLALGLEQLITVCGEDFADWFKKQRVNLLMTHQPPGWLTGEALNFLNGEIAPVGRFALHLFGHMHEGNLSNIATGGTTGRLYLQTRSLFGLDQWGDQKQRSHGYTVGSLSFNLGAETATLRLWPRTAQKHQAGHWHMVADPTFSLLQDDGTEGKLVRLNPRVPAAIKRLNHQTGKGDITTELFRVLILATDTDLGNARSAVVHYLTTALGVEALPGSGIDIPHRALPT